MLKAKFIDLTPHFARTYSRKTKTWATDLIGEKYCTIYINYKEADATISYLKELEKDLFIMDLKISKDNL